MNNTCITTGRDQLKSKLKQLLEVRRRQLEEISNQLSEAQSQLTRRRNHLLRQLWDIYPIVEFPDGKGYSICDIYLPSSENFEGHDELMVSVAIGYVGHLLLLLGEILDVQLRFPVKFYGSKSYIYCNRRDQQFPLYLSSFKSRDKVNFSHAVNLLNLNILQIRNLHGLPTNYPEETLANLHGLRIYLSRQIALDTS